MTGVSPVSLSDSVLPSERRGSSDVVFGPPRWLSALLSLCDLVVSIDTCRRCWPMRREKPTWETSWGFPPAVQSSDRAQKNSGRRWRPRSSPRDPMGRGHWEAGEERKIGKQLQNIAFWGYFRFFGYCSLKMICTDMTWSLRKLRKYVKQKAALAGIWDTLRVPWDYLVKPGAHAALYSLEIYLYFKPERPCMDIQAVRVEDKILSAEVEMRRSVSKGPGGEAGSSVRHQVQRHVTGACRRQEKTNTDLTCLSLSRGNNLNANISVEPDVLIWYFRSSHIPFNISGDIYLQPRFFFTVSKSKLSSRRFYVILLHWSQEQCQLTFHSEGHFDGPPAGLLFRQQLELYWRAGSHLRSRQVPVLPERTKRWSSPDRREWLVCQDCFTDLLRNFTGRNHGYPQKGRSSRQWVRKLSLISGTWGVMCCMPV